MKDNELPPNPSNFSDFFTSILFGALFILNVYGTHIVESGVGVVVMAFVGGVALTLCVVNAVKGVA